MADSASRQVRSCQLKVLSTYLLELPVVPLRVGEVLLQLLGGPSLALAQAQQQHAQCQDAP